MPFDLDRLSRELKPFRLHYYPQLDSTNDTAMALRRQGELFAPAVILTAAQTAGRGRAGNRWLSDAGSLTVTYVLPVEENLQPHQLPLVAGIAVRNAATEMTGNTEIALKWPNDIVHLQRKLAGVLCERIAGVEIIGVGLNVNSAPHVPAGRRTALCLSDLSGQRHNLTDALLLLSSHLRQTLLARQSHTFSTFVEEYRQHDALLGRELLVQVPGEAASLRGTCEGIDAEGWLLVRPLAGGLRRIIAGSIETIS